MSIPVPIPGQEVSAEIFGKPVADAINGTAWVSFALLNGATTVNARPPQYRKVLSDVVQIRGHVRTLGTSVFATLPVGFRPMYDVEFPVSLYAGSRLPGVLLVSYTGDISLYDVAGNAGIEVQFSTLPL